MIQVLLKTARNSFYFFSFPFFLPVSCYFGPGTELIDEERRALLSSWPCSVMILPDRRYRLWLQPFFYPLFPSGAVILAGCNGVISHSRSLLVPLAARAHPDCGPNGSNSSCSMSSLGFFFFWNFLFLFFIFLFSISGSLCVCLLPKHPDLWLHFWLGVVLIRPSGWNSRAKKDGSQKEKG